MAKPRQNRTASPAEPSYRVLRDTSEHEGKGWWFPVSERCLGTVEKNLYTADYSLEGYYDNKLFVVERKGSVAEFAANLTQKDKWDDFKQVLERMEEFRWPFLVLEFPQELIKTYPVGSGIPAAQQKLVRLTGRFLLRRVCEIELRYKTKIVYTGGCGRDYVSSLFKRVTEAVPCPSGQKPSPEPSPTRN